MCLIYGFIGAILALLLFGGGVICGWKCNDKLREKKAVIAEQTLGEEERQRLKQEQDAFRTMLNYNSDMAYGVGVAETLQESEVT